MKKYISPKAQLDIISKNDVIMASGDPILSKGEYLVAAPDDWFGMGIE